MIPSKRDALKRQIEQAFIDTPRPNDDHIGYNPDDWESAELTAAFKGKHWRDLLPEELKYNSSTFLSSEGFRYYLPAYLFAALDDYGDLLPHTVYNLTAYNLLSEDKEINMWKLERFERFSIIEKRAIRAFLEYVRDEFLFFSGGRAPRLALESYWAAQ